MTTLVFAAEGYTRLAAGLLTFADQTLAILLAQPAARRLLVVETHPAPEGSRYGEAGTIGGMPLAFLTPLVKQAQEEGLAMVLARTQHCASPSFTAQPETDERELATFLREQVPGRNHAALMISPGGCQARHLGGGESMDVIEVGPWIRRVSVPGTNDSNGRTWDRQVLAFGAEGQAHLRAVRAVIVGCGGTGSVVAQQLAHLGVGDITLVDPDVVEESNLNRVVGASIRDIGQSKVSVVAKMVREIGLATSVRTLQADVREKEVASSLTEADAIICCTDTHASRAIINQIAYQYMIPAFDVGVAIGALEGQISNVTARVQMLAPGLACLVCGNVLDYAEIRRELQTDELLALDRYVVGHNIAQPAVISINSTASSLLVTMFLAAFTGAPLRARLQFYDAILGRVRVAAQLPAPTCVVCSGAGALGKGDRWPLPARPST
jgi:molybdopterin-synthase adenylyltransferase